MLGQSSLLASMMAAPSGLRPQDVFATSLYTGNGGTQTITNGINLSGEGGLVWIKPRGSVGSMVHQLVTTNLGGSYALCSSNTDALSTAQSRITSFNSNGFSLGAWPETNTNTESFVSWTFRRAPKFFDVVTWTGTGAAGRQFTHNLGIVPGLIITKKVSASGSDWNTWHRSASGFLTLNTTNSEGGSTIFGPVTSAYFEMGSHPNPNWFNENGFTYVAYLFAHDTDTSGVVQCGSYTGNGSGTGPTITLGWNPQFLLLKCSGAAKNWWIYDSARSASNPRINKMMANLSSAEDTSGKNVDFLSTGFQLKSSLAEVNSPGISYVYLAIREPV